MLLGNFCSYCGAKMKNVRVILREEEARGAAPLEKSFCSQCIAHSRNETSRLAAARTTEAQTGDTIFEHKERNPQSAGDINEALARWK